MTLSTRQLRLIGAVAAVNVLLVAGGWMALISPQRHDAATAAAQAQVAQSQLDATTGSSQGPTKQPVIDTADLYSLDTALPSQTDQADLLFELDRVAKASGVKITNLSPQAAQATAMGYTVQPINLQLDGSYFQVTDFLRNLRLLVSKKHGRLIANGPLFGVTSASFSGAESDGDAPSTVGIEAFYYGVTAGATPPASTTATDTTTTTGG